MPFKNKSNATENRLDKLNEKILELNNDLEKVKKKVLKFENEVGKTLSSIALDNRTEDHENLATAKQRHLKAKEEVFDIQGMIQAVNKEKARLEIELLEAVIRETPSQCETVAKDFNSTLDDALAVMGQLEVIFGKLREEETEFYRLHNSHSNALANLGRIQGLELKESLGRLSTASGAHRSTFTCGTQLQYFVASLLGYREKLAGFEAFKTDNPQFSENLERTKEAQKPLPWAKMMDWNWLRQ